MVEADLVDFFDTLDWTILRGILEAEISDSDVIALVHRFIRTGAFHGHRLTPVPQGVPQGAVCSPLLANAYLTSFDRLMTTSGYLLVRYGDEFLTLHRTRHEANAAFHLMREVLAGHLKLRLHPKKTGIVDVHRQTFDFLSFRFSKEAVVPTPHAVQRFQDQAQARIRAARRQGMTAVVMQLNPLIRGWGEYFKIAQVTDLYQQLDAWIAVQLGIPPGCDSGMASLVALHKRYRRQRGLES